MSVHPHPADEHFSFHWLYHPRGKDIWRWRGRRWISVYTQVDFTSEQMADQGWIYDAPIIPTLVTPAQRAPARSCAT